LSGKREKQKPFSSDLTVGGRVGKLTGHMVSHILYTTTAVPNLKNVLELRHEPPN